MAGKKKKVVHLDDKIDWKVRAGVYHKALVDIAHAAKASRLFNQPLAEREDKEALDVLRNHGEDIYYMTLIGRVANKALVSTEG